jgi:hypothetical protein
MKTEEEKYEEMQKVLKQFPQGEKAVDFFADPEIKATLL